VHDNLTDVPSPRPHAARLRVAALAGLAVLATAPAAFAQDAAPTTQPGANGYGGVTPEQASTVETPTPAPPASSKQSSAVRTLKPGSRGPRVRSLQRRLKVKVSSVYDRRTKTAVVRFQKRKKLTADGIAGPVTLRALGLVSKSSTSGKAADVTLPDTIHPRSKLLLDLIAECESGGRLDAVSPGGTYRGKYQFHRDTWASVGGTVDPIKASEDEQDKRAYVLFRRSGVRQWPVCGPKAADERRRREAASS
jgi:hypothetical protein